VTRAELRTFLQNLGHGTGTAEVTAQNEALKAAYLDFAGRQPWSWMRKFTTAGTLATSASVVANLPANFAYPLNIRLTNVGGQTTGYEDLEYRDPDLLDSDLNLDDGTGVPTYWTWRASELVVYPRANAAYTTRIDYIKRAATTEFDDDSDVLPFQEQYHHAVGYLAAAILAYRARDFAGEDRMTGKAEQIIANAIREDKTPRQTHVREWGGWDAGGV
jgi:hypothetical protein